MFKSIGGVSTQSLKPHETPAAASPLITAQAPSASAENSTGDTFAAITSRSRWAAEGRVASNQVSRSFEGLPPPMDVSQVKRKDPLKGLSPGVAQWLEPGSRVLDLLGLTEGTSPATLEEIVAASHAIARQELNAYWDAWGPRGLDAKAQKVLGNVLVYPEERQAIDANHNFWVKTFYAEAVGDKSFDIAKTPLHPVLRDAMRWEYLLGLGTGRIAWLAFDEFKGGKDWDGSELTDFPLPDVATRESLKAAARIALAKLESLDRATLPEEQRAFYDRAWFRLAARAVDAHNSDAYGPDQLQTPSGRAQSFNIFSNACGRGLVKDTDKMLRQLIAYACTDSDLAPLKWSDSTSFTTVDKWDFPQEVEVEKFITMVPDDGTRKAFLQIANRFRQQLAEDVGASRASGKDQLFYTPAEQLYNWRAINWLVGNRPEKDSTFSSYLKREETAFSEHFERYRDAFKRCMKEFLAAAPEAKPISPETRKNLLAVITKAGTMSSLIDCVEALLRKPDGSPTEALNAFQKTRTAVVSVHALKAARVSLFETFGKSDGPG